MKFKLSRGEIWYANLDPVVGHEQAKTRPCLVVSHNAFNDGNTQLVIVTPLTSRNRKNPLHVEISPPEGGLSVPSVILCDQIRSISHKRVLDRCLGKVDDATLAKVEYILAVLMNIRPKSLDDPE